MKRLAIFLSTAGGAGHSPKAPGTAGSLVGLAVFWWIARLPLTGQIGFVFVGCVAALWAVKGMQQHYSVHDDSRIVIDEVIGMWITLCGIPVTIAWYAAGFFLFRLLDIWKPFPANYIDREWPGARGVVFDDVAAGLMGALLLYLARIAWPYLGATAS